MIYANRFKQIILAMVLFTLLSLVSLSVSAQTDTVEIEVGRGTVVTDTIGELEIFLTPSLTSNALSVITTEIAYDGSLMEVFECSLLDFIGVCNLDTDGLIKISAVNLSGITAREAIAILKLNPLGVSGNRIDFVPTTTLIADSAGTSIADYLDVIGRVTINKTAVPTAISLNDGAVFDNYSIYLLLPVVLLVLLIALVILAKRKRKH